MEYLTVKEAGEKWGVTARMVNHYCSTGRIPDAIKKGNLWLVPADAEKPKDGRTKELKIAERKEGKSMTSDLHIHPLSHKYYFNMDSVFADVVLDEEDKMNIRAVVDWCYHVRKLDAIALTDHDMIQAGLYAREYAQKSALPIHVVTGVEASVCDPKEPLGENEVHLLCLGIEKLPKYNFDTSVEKMIEKVHKLGGCVIMSHPIKYPRSFGRYCHLLDGYEYLNSGFDPFDEGRDILSKRKLSLHEYYNSDYHYEGKGEFPEANAPALHCNHYEGSVLYGAHKKEANAMPGKSVLSQTEYMSILLSGKEFPNKDVTSFLPPNMDLFFTDLLAGLGIKSRDDVVKLVDKGGQRSYYHDVMSGNLKTHADLDYYIRIALALGLNLQTTQSMLAISGHGCMHPRIKKHAAAIFAINHKYSIERYEAFLKQIGEMNELNMHDAAARLPDTEVMWNLLKGDTFPREGYLLVDKKEFFDDLLAEYGVKKSEIIKKALMDKGYGYEVLGGRAKASRDYYIRIALEMGLDFRTTQRLLAVTDSGCMYSRLVRDGAIIFAINNNFNYERTINLLAELKQDPLDGREKGMSDSK